MIALTVLWLYGASGVGKTTVTWELFVQLAREDAPTGYVDIDQLGMCYGPPTPQRWAPEPADDPGRHRLKARTLDAVVANFRDAGARRVVVPGVTDPVRGVETDLVPHAALTTCRLRAEPAELGRRLAARGSPFDDLAQELGYADALDRAFATEACVDTTGLTVAEVVDRVRARTGWPNLAAPVAKRSPPRQVPDPTPGLAGDELIGQPQARLREIADQAARILDALDGVGDLRVDTDGRPADEIAAEILARTGWPSLRR